MADVYAAYLHPNELSASFHKSITALKEYDERIGGWGVVRSSGYGIPEARNTVIDYFLGTEAEWLWWVDADMGFEPDVLDRLLAVADPETRPIVGGLCFAYQEQGFDPYSGIRAKPMPTIYEWAGDNFKGRAHYPVNQLVQTAATGFAMLLTHRSVLEKMFDEYGPNWCDRIPKEKLKIGDGPFGEDMSFFLRAGALDFPVFVHTGVRTSHQKTIFVQEEDFWTSFHAPPATEQVDVVVPTVRARSGNIPGLAASLKATTGLATLVLVLDDEDHRKELEGLGVDTADSVIAPGRFPVKVNAGYSATTADWVQMVGDDCTFHPGWLDHQQWVAKNNAAKVVGSNDLANPRVIRGEHATHFMLARDYVEESGGSWDNPGRIIHEGYKHWFTDDEVVTKARQEGVFQAALGAVIEHHHPIVGKAEHDDVYRKNDLYAERDRKLFERRVRKYVDA